MRVTNQGGSLASFLIIGALLLLVFAGGLYGLNRYNSEQANKEVATSDQSKGDKKTETEVQKETESEASESTGRQTTPDIPPTEQKTDSQSASPAQSSQLPQTGPSDTPLTLAALAVVTFFATHYVRSRASL